jgi:hypothetical protein
MSVGEGTPFGGMGAKAATRTPRWSPLPPRTSGAREPSRLLTAGQQSPQIPPVAALAGTEPRKKSRSRASSISGEVVRGAEAATPRLSGRLPCLSRHQEEVGGYWERAALVFTWLPPTSPDPRGASSRTAKANPPGWPFASSPPLPLGVDGFAGPADYLEALGLSPLVLAKQHAAKLGGERIVPIVKGHSPPSLGSQPQQATVITVTTNRKNAPSESPAVTAAYRVDTQMLRLCRYPTTADARDTIAIETAIALGASSHGSSSRKPPNHPRGNRTKHSEKRKTVRTVALSAIRRLVWVGLHQSPAHAPLVLTRQQAAELIQVYDRCRVVQSREGTRRERAQKRSQRVPSPLVHTSGQLDPRSVTSLALL